MINLLLFVSCTFENKSACISKNKEYKLLLTPEIVDSAAARMIIEKIKNSEQIGGPIKSPFKKNLALVNLTDNDTLIITFYGPDRKMFSIKNCYYQSEVSVIPHNSRNE